MNKLQTREDALFEHISALIDIAHKRVKTVIDTTMVYTYYGIGQYIVEDEQQGEQRAQYGQAVLKNLSVKGKQCLPNSIRKRQTVFTQSTLQCRSNSKRKCSTQCSQSFHPFLVSLSGANAH